jgi:uncharacterized protein
MDWKTVLHTEFFDIVSLLKRPELEKLLETQYILVMDFDWDKQKAASNLYRHKVSFEEAATVFGNPLSDTFDDPDHSATEKRFLIIGHSKKGRLLFVSHTDDGETVRIISARELTRTERELYEQG